MRFSILILIIFLVSVSSALAQCYTAQIMPSCKKILNEDLCSTVVSSIHYVSNFGCKEAELVITYNLKDLEGADESELKISIFEESKLSPINSQVDPAKKEVKARISKNGYYAVTSKVPVVFLAASVCTSDQFDPTNCRRCKGDGTWHPSCTDYGHVGTDASLQQWCACELKCTGKNVNPDCITVTKEPVTTEKPRETSGTGNCANDRTCNYYFLFVPVDGWVSQNEFNQKVHERATFFIDISKFKYSKIGVIPLPISSECNSLLPVAVSLKNPLESASALSAFFRAINRCAKNYANSLGISYEKIIALSPKVYSEVGKIGIADNFYAPSAYASVGWSGQPNRGIPIVAHETGHLYGLCEEYSYDMWQKQNENIKKYWPSSGGCPNAWPSNCPKDNKCLGNSNIYRAYSGPPLPGVECSSGTRYCVMGNAGGSSNVCGYDNTGGYNAVGPSQVIVPPTSVCDPITQPLPNWGVKNNQCLKSCGALGGKACCTNGCDSAGSAGSSYDCPYCCKSGCGTVTTTPTSVCDPVTQPSPHWGVKGSSCLKSCGALGGKACCTNGCDSAGSAGSSYDCSYCCKSGCGTVATTPTTSISICDPVTQPSPHWGVKGSSCLKSCGALGGKACCTNGCDNAGSAGSSYDCSYCCKSGCQTVATIPKPICDPVKQPSPHWGVKGSSCLKSCGALGGKACCSKGCNSAGSAGSSYDCNYCCKGGCK